MTNADDQTPAVPPVPPVTPTEPPAAAAASDTPPPASPYSAPEATPTYAATPPTYTPSSAQNPYGSAPAGYAPGGVAPSRGLSIASMILGILGVLGAGPGLLLSIAAVITGHMAQRRQPYARGFWLTGLITGYAGILFGLIVIALFIFIFIIAAASGTSGDYYYDS
jgi:hypothetical protein